MPRLRLTSSVVVEQLYLFRARAGVKHTDRLTTRIIHDHALGRALPTKLSTLTGPYSYDRTAWLAAHATPRRNRHALGHIGYKLASPHGREDSDPQGAFWLTLRILEHVTYLTLHGLQRHTNVLLEPAPEYASILDELANLDATVTSITHTDPDNNQRRQLDQARQGLLIAVTDAILKRHFDELHAQEAAAKEVAIDAQRAQQATAQDVAGLNRTLIEKAIADAETARQQINDITS